MMFCWCLIAPVTVRGVLHVLPTPMWVLHFLSTSQNHASRLVTPDVPGCTTIHADSYIAASGAEPHHIDQPFNLHGVFIHSSFV